MAKTLENVISEVMGEMREENSELCLASYRDNCFYDNCIVMFMDLGNYTCVHEAMQVLHDKLSSKLGYPVSLCHNHPTDESVLIHGSEDDSRSYDRATCCKTDDLEQCMKYLETKTGYRDEVHAMALAAEYLGEQLGTHAERILDNLDWDLNPTVQLTHMMLDIKQAEMALSAVTPIQFTTLDELSEYCSRESAERVVTVTVTIKHADSVGADQMFNWKVATALDYNMLEDMIISAINTTVEDGNQVGCFFEVK